MSVFNKPPGTIILSLIALLAGLFILLSGMSCTSADGENRERISINDGWTIMKYDSSDEADSLIYDVRLLLSEYDDSQSADTEQVDAINADADLTRIIHEKV